MTFQPLLFGSAGGAVSEPASERAGPGRGDETPPAASAAAAPFQSNINGRPMEEECLRLGSVSMKPVLAVSMLALALCSVECCDLYGD